jgi:hypothetical protein
LPGESAFDLGGTHQQEFWSTIAGQRLQAVTIQTFKG